MRIAVLQPTFLPWIGWFDILDQVDTLVLLDDVAFSKQSWQQRNRLRTPRGLEVTTVPVKTSGCMGQLIREAEISDLKFVRKLDKTIAACYSRAPFFEEFYPSFIKALHIGSESGMLSRLNESLIEWFCLVLGVQVPICKSSELDANGKRGEYVAALCHELSANTYISPAGAEAYLLEDRMAFDRRDITVELHEYVHPVYHQVFQPFIPYASTLDLLFNEGPNALAIIRSGRRCARALGA